MLETNGSGSTLASYVLGGTGLISQTRGSTTRYFLQDGQGSTRALTSSTGTVTDTYSYTAFGEQFSSSGTTVNPYRYTGQQFDSLTNLYSLRARYYNPALGRFLSQDTYPVNFNNPIELNRYVYTANDPINLTDPTGNAALVEYALRGAAFGGLVGAVSTYACGGNLGENIAIGMLFGVGFGVGLAYAPLATNAVGLAFSGAGAVSAFHDKQMRGWNTCNRFNFAISLLGVAFSAGGLVKGGIDYINNNILGGLSNFGYPQEMLYPTMGHEGYYTEGLIQIKGTTTIYRFANGPQDLVSNLSRLPDSLREMHDVALAYMLRSAPEELMRSIEAHASGHTNNSPFISAVLDPNAAAATTDVVRLQPIVRNTRFLYELEVPNELLYYPQNSLSQRETEVLVLADSLVQYITKWIDNPFLK